MVRELEFKALCSRYSDDIYRYAYSLLGNRADAEDASQEVLLRIWGQLPKINLFNARAWVLRITRNYCLDQMRRCTPALVGEESLLEQPDELAASPGQGADGEFLNQQILAALMALPETHRSVFILYEINGLRYREIALTLSVPLNTVKVYLARAREKLKELLTQHESWIRP